MNFLDVITFIVGVSGVMIVFVAKTNLEKSRVRVKIKAKQTKK